ncbi:hypothetical protein [Paeniglutamicibacter sp.]|uniref:hypothetical protein n=1 Tax=Paeniglutamicibacter sp. TaxID=1934391 RepID=UPI003988D8C4
MGRQLDIITQTLTITKETQAERVNNLVAMWALRSGSPLKIGDLQTFMSQRKITISTSTWHALRNTAYKVVKLEILSGVADYFDIDKSFLMYEEAAVPEEYKQNLEKLEQNRVEEAVEAMHRHASRLPQDLRHVALCGLIYRLAERRPSSSG